VEAMTEFDEELHPQPSNSPESLAIAGDDRAETNASIGYAATEVSRKVLVLPRTGRLFDKEIRSITSIPHRHGDVRTGARAAAAATKTLTNVVPQEAPVSCELTKGVLHGYLDNELGCGARS